VATLFAVALFVGTAAIALWIDVRKPSLAPDGLIWRAACAFVAIEACGMIPIANGSFLALYTSIFAVLLPMLIAMWLTAVWLLRAISDSLLAHR
jgi:hypothetical protein